MNIKLSTEIKSKILALVAVFVLVFAPLYPALAQVTFNDGFGDAYSYSDSYSYGGGYGDSSSYYSPISYNDAYGDAYSYFDSVSYNDAYGDAYSYYDTPSYNDAYGDAYAYYDSVSYNDAYGDAYAYYDSVSYNDAYGDAYAYYDSVSYNDGYGDAYAYYDSVSYNDAYGDAYAYYDSVSYNDGYGDAYAYYDSVSYNDAYGDAYAYTDQVTYNDAYGDYYGYESTPVGTPTVPEVPFVPDQPVYDTSIPPYDGGYIYTDGGFTGGGFYGGGFIPTYNYGGGGFAYTSVPFNSYTYTSYDYPNPERRPVCTLEITPNHIDKGERATLRWTTEHARTVTLSDGIGTVARDGSRSISPNESKTYVLVASGPGGTVTCSDHITVDEDRDHDRDVKCDAFTVSDRKVEKGDKVTLEWRTTGARDVEINQGIGDVDDDGSVRVEINRDITFKLTAKNGNDTDTCTVEVEVEDKKKDNDKGPRCELRVSDKDVRKGDTVKLSWDNLRTDRIVLKDGNGKEIVDSKDDKKIDEDKDSISVKVTKDTKYTLTAYNGNEKDTCSVNVDVDAKNTVSVTSVRGQDKITLSQVPYTGFEAGPVLTTIFYSVLGLWGAMIAYILVFKGKVATVAGAATATAALPNIAPVVSSLAATVATPVRDIPSMGIPTNLPVAEEVAMPVFEEDVHDVVKMLEQHAHASYALISSDALRFIAGQYVTHEERIATLDRVIALAKARFPKEGDWVVINKERVLTLLA